MLEESQASTGDWRLLRIAEEGVAIANGEPVGFGLQMHAFRRPRIEPAELEARQDVQHDERGDALVVRRDWQMS